MIVGDRNLFAIESSITEALPSLGQRALGYFVIHILGKIYGVREPNASLLACSFDEVCARLARRGTHKVSYLSDIDAHLIVEAYLDAIYRNTARNDYCQRTRSEFSDDLYDVGAPWAPDGDEAFDDGSIILQFDVGDKVRLIAFQSEDWSVETAHSVEDIWIDGHLFYGVLSEWSTLFAAQWAERVRDAKPEGRSI